MQQLDKLLGSFSEKYLGKYATNFLTDVTENDHISIMPDKVKIFLMENLE